MKKTILEKAHEIVNNRSEDKERRYGNFEECMTRVSKLASIISDKEITVDDTFVIMMALKLSRESHYHKEDNLIDLLGYIQGWHDYRESQLPSESKLTEEELEEKIVSQYKDPIPYHTPAIDLDSWGIQPLKGPYMHPNLNNLSP